jgi:DNA-binding NtrC family response regulator
MGASWDDVQRTYAMRVLDHCDNNKTRAAEMLQVSRKTLYDKMRRWGVFGTPV